MANFTQGYLVEPNGQWIPMPPIQAPMNLIAQPFGYAPVGQPVNSLRDADCCDLCCWPLNQCLACCCGCCVCSEEEACSDCCPGITWRQIWCGSCTYI